MQEKKIQIRQPLVGHKTDYIWPPGDENMPVMIAHLSYDEVVKTP
jgi:hypothetical protein